MDAKRLCSMVEQRSVEPVMAHAQSRELDPLPAKHVEARAFRLFDKAQS